jgi:hypothetical protein
MRSFALATSGGDLGVAAVPNSDLPESRERARNIWLYADLTLALFGEGTASGYWKA